MRADLALWPLLLPGLMTALIDAAGGEFIPTLAAILGGVLAGQTRGQTSK